MVPTTSLRLLLTVGLVMAFSREVQSQGTLGTGTTGYPVAGAVLRDGGTPLPFARVTLMREGAADSVLREVVASADGRFVLRDISAGTYRVIARQIGFRPAEAAVIIADGAPAVLTLQMERLAIALPEVIVEASELSCADSAMRAGRDDPRLEVLRGLLVENSARISAFVRSYPIEVQMRSRMTTFGAAGEALLVKEDSLSVVGKPGDDYRPGDVLQPRREGRRLLGYRINIPNMGAIGSPGFQRSHCFAFGGGEMIDGRPTLRLLVAPDGPALRVTDVAGAFYLDAQSGILRRSELSLTNIPRESLGQVTLETEFAEPFPGFALRRIATYTQQLLPGSRLNGMPVVRDVEVVETSGFRFVNARPDGAPPSVRFPTAATP